MKKILPFLQMKKLNPSICYLLSLILNPLKAGALSYLTLLSHLVPALGSSCDIQFYVSIQLTFLVKKSISTLPPKPVFS